MSGFVCCHEILSSVRPDHTTAAEETISRNELFSLKIHQAHVQIYQQFQNDHLSPSSASWVTFFNSFIIFLFSPEIPVCLQVSEDDSYPSDVSDNISMDNFSNGTESDRQNPGIYSDF